MSATEDLKQICKELADQGIWPPYRLNIGDGEGNTVALDVTVTYTMKNTRVVAEAPIEYLGSATELSGAEAIQDCEKLLGQETEIVVHDHTYYVISK